MDVFFNERKNDNEKKLNFDGLLLNDNFLKCVCFRKCFELWWEINEFGKINGIWDFIVFYNIFCKYIEKFNIF